MGCMKDSDETNSKCIEGEWRWVESVGGIGGWTITPQTEGYEQTLKIEKNTYKEYINDSLVYTSDYTIGESSENQIGTESKNFIKIEKGTLAFTCSDKQLNLFEQCFDCYIHSYIRR